MKLTLEDLAYDDFFESNRKKLKLDGFGVARVLAEYRGSYKIRNEKGEYSAKITGKQMQSASSREDYPAVGDWVAMTDLDGKHATIHGILPRRTIIKRKRDDRSRTGEKTEIQVIAANIDVAFIVESIDRDFSLNRFERYLALAKDGGVTPVLVLNKIDLLTPKELEAKLAELKNRFNGIEVIPTSAVSDEVLEVLRAHIQKGKTYCFLGSSGVGKSSLINKLIRQETIKTGGIGSGDGRGKHTTTAREMYFMDNGGIVIDNPGMRQVGLTDAEAGISESFDEIISLSEQCEFRDCTHTHEPDCAVLTALNSGKLDPEQYSNYTNLKKEAVHFEMTELERKQKDRRFGQMVKKAIHIKKRI